MAWGIGSFKARKNAGPQSCLCPRPFRLDAQTHSAGRRVSSATVGRLASGALVGGKSGVPNAAGSSACDLIGSSIRQGA